MTHFKEETIFPFLKELKTHKSAIKKEVLNNHISFWLNWDVKTLINRIKDSKKRPIASKSTINEIEDLIKKRSIIYSKAMYKINCENLTKSEIVKKIIKIYEAH